MKSISDNKVYRRSPAYQRGWVKGFYDCRRSDDGATDNARMCAMDDVEERAGYLAGRFYRVTAVLRELDADGGVAEAA